MSKQLETIRDLEDKILELGRELKKQRIQITPYGYPK